MSLAERYAAVRARVPDGVTLIAVSKKQPVSAVLDLYALGHRDFGENYAQELAEKAAVLRERGCAEARWHMIGHVQTNKVKILAPWIFSVHTVDSERLAQALAARWKGPVFIEVNIDGEATKAGVPAADAPALCEAVSRVLPVSGLMCIPSAADTRPAFTRLRELGARCRAWTEGKLSMGMSSDFETAILEGSTHVRVGTAIFGER